MNELFASLYENIFGLFDQQFDLIFLHLYENGGYTNIGLVFLIIPLLSTIIFYFLVKHPYLTIWHWISWIAITGIIVLLMTYGITRTEIFASGNTQLTDALSDAEWTDYANTLPIKYGIYNGLLALIMGFIYSLLIKNSRFSKIQVHLPF